MRLHKTLIINSIRAVSYILERRIHCGLHVFNYHQVGRCFDGRVNYAPTFTSIDHFARQLKYLQTKFKFVPLSEGMSLLSDIRVKKEKWHLAALTFDDGDVTLKEAVPVALDMKIPVTLFINTDYLGDEKKSWVNALAYQIWCEKNRMDFLPKPLAEDIRLLRTTTDKMFYNRTRLDVEARFCEVRNVPRQYLTYDELWKMTDSSISVALHGAEHQRISMMPYEFFVADIERNIATLKKHPRYVPIFAVPFGRAEDISDYSIGYCLSHGIKVALHSNGYNRSSLPIIYRIPADRKRITLSSLANTSIPI